MASILLILLSVVMLFLCIFQAECRGAPFRPCDGLLALRPPVSGYVAVTPAMMPASAMLAFVSGPVGFFG